MTARRGFGTVRKLPSGRVQARYRGPDGRMRPAPVTFDTRGDAEVWLSVQHAEIVRGTWRAPEAALTTLAGYADGWLAGRDLKPRTRAHYRKLLDAHVYPALGAVPLGRLTPTVVREWHTRLGETTGPTMRAHAYSLLRSVLNTAAAEDVIVSNPCRVRGAGTSKRVKQIRPATLPELTALAGAMPAAYRAMVLLAAWCGLRFGELAELRRFDLDVAAGVLRVQRAVVRVDGQAIVGTPKSDAGTRRVAIPPHLLPVLAEHLAQHCASAPDALLFPARSGGHLAPSSLHRVFYRARDAAGQPDLRFHDLRHTGAVLAAATGATLAELMARIGHSTPAAAMRYQHAAEDRDQAIALALSDMAMGVVVPLRRRGTA